MQSVLDRFLRYVRIDTQSSLDSATIPSTAKQLDLSRLLADELRELGLSDVSMSESGIVIATIPATVTHDAPTIVWNAHVDTSPETSGTDVDPILHENYDGTDIVLPKDKSKVIRVAENPTLTKLIGETIITTDGTTLLGADDKAGVAIIMAATEALAADSTIPHGPIRVVFTVDEEIGKGIATLDVKGLNAVCAYTLDGEGSGKIDCETFSADEAIVTVTGVNTHPSVGKDTMVNSLRILSEFVSKLPTQTHSPETTDGRDGFLHPYHFTGTVVRSSARILLRGFETETLTEYAELLNDIADELRAKHPKATIEVAIREQYRNMGEGLKQEPRAVEKAQAAMRAIGIQPELTIVRGGTDGSMMTAAGLPTPNLSAAEHNPHSPLEWSSVKELETGVSMLVELAKEWGTERAEG